MHFWDCHIIAERHVVFMLWWWIILSLRNQAGWKSNRSNYRVLRFLFSPSQLMGSQDCCSLEVMRCTSRKQILPRGGGKNSTAAISHHVFPPSHRHNRSKRHASARAWTAFSCSLASASSLSSCAYTVAEDGNCAAQRSGPHRITR